MTKEICTNSDILKFMPVALKNKILAILLIILLEKLKQHPDFV